VEIRNLNPGAPGQIRNSKFKTAAEGSNKAGEAFDLEEEFGSALLKSSVIGIRPPP
jgi:hypothetical protein